MGSSTLCVLYTLMGFVLSVAVIEAVGWQSSARKTLPISSLKDVKRFSKSEIVNYRTLNLDEEAQVLYVGAREALFALNSSDITVEVQKAIPWQAPAEKKKECIQKGRNNQTDCFNYIRFIQHYNSSHLYTCGTFAFQPKCTYIEVPSFTFDRFAVEDGKGKCPYDPTKGHTGLIVDGEMYSATLNNFLGTEPVIIRNLGKHHAMKTEHLASWLNEPHFVGSAHVKGSTADDDDEIYFFFSERAVEYSCYSKQVVARVARVCKGDVGGARTLQRKWTTFLKAHLTCSVPEKNIHFSKIQAVYTLHGSGGHDTQFFIVFQSHWKDMDASAVCQYQVTSVQEVLNGSYKEYREQAQKWVRYSDSVPLPRPGACLNAQSEYSSSLDLPDNTLNFAKKHPLMDEQVRPMGDQPLMIKERSNFTQIVVDRVIALDGQSYTVLFIGTGDGWLNKAVVVGSHVHVIEEMQLFDEALTVESLTISRRQKLLYAGSWSQIVQLPVADCSQYGFCTDCLLARDPYCAWNSRREKCVNIDAEHRSPSDDWPFLIQSVEQGNCALCLTKTKTRINTLDERSSISVQLGTNFFLPCPHVSNLAVPTWTFNGNPLLYTKSMYYDIQLKALVIWNVREEHKGEYNCSTREQGCMLATHRYYVTVTGSHFSVLTSKAQVSVDSVGLVWMVVIALGVVCTSLLLALVYLRCRLKNQKEKSSKTMESTIIYPIDLPKEPKSPQFIPSTMSDSDEKLWDPTNYYYSDGSLKIVPGHAVCQNGGSSIPSPTSNGIPGQPIPSPPLPSPNRINLGNIRGSTSNGYIRLQLGVEEKPDYSDLLTEELRKKLKLRQVLPDCNPEESSV